MAKKPAAGHAAENPPVVPPAAQEKTAPSMPDAGVIPAGAETTTGAATTSAAPVATPPAPPPAAEVEGVLVRILAPVDVDGARHDIGALATFPPAVADRLVLGLSAELV